MMHYTERLTKAGMELNKKYPPAVWVSAVQHDDWCPMMAGHDNCMCIPDITLVSGKRTLVVDKEGNLSEEGVTQ